MFWSQRRPTSQKYKESMRKKRNAFFALTILILILLSTFIFWVGYSDTFRINTIALKGITTIQDTVLRNDINEILTKKTLWVLPRNNTLFFPRYKLSENLLKSFTEIKNLKIDTPDQNTLLFTIEERKSVGVWCHENATEAFEECFLLDEFGYIFTKAPTFSGNLFFKYYGGMASSTPIDSLYLPEETFRERVFFITSLETLGLNPVSYKWGQDGDSTITLKAEGSSGVEGVLLFNNEDDLATIFEHISLALTHEDFKERGIRTIEVEYIDLRSENKIFYKLE